MKTLKDLENMKLTKCVPFNNSYEFLFQYLEDSYISKVDGLSRIKCKLEEWDLEAQKVIIQELSERLRKSGINFDKNELL